METAKKKKYTEFTCTKCDVSKPLTQFHKDSTSSRGHRTICKSCKKEADSRRVPRQQQPIVSESVPLTEEQIQRNLKSRANYAALVKLIENHPLEFDRLVKVEQKKLGFEKEKSKWISISNLD